MSQNIQKVMESAKEKEKYKGILMREELYLRQVWLIAQSALPPPPEVGQESQEVLRCLNHARREHQSAISEIIAHTTTNVCVECKGRCCYLGRVEERRYYSIDFWLRYYTTSPIPNQDEILINHPAEIFPGQVYKRVLRQIRNLVSRMHLAPIIEIIRKYSGIPQREVSNWPPKITDKSFPCGFVSSRGCTLEPGDRPLICILYTCHKLRQALDAQTFKDMVQQYKGLKAIHNDVLKLLRREGRLGYFSGWSRLAIPSLSYNSQGIKHVRKIF